MSPSEFARNVLNLEPDNYISLTSFTHHPFYKTFSLEIPDNWLMALSYNVTLDELQEAVDSALAQGYTVAWGGDTSEPFFLAYDQVAFATPIISTSKNMSPFETPSRLRLFKCEETEPQVTQELRQKQFDDYGTTDDHAMHIVGKAHDAQGRSFYKLKNSWGKDKTTRTNFTGYVYISEAYMRLKTVNVLMHKDAIPSHIRKKLGI